MGVALEQGRSEVRRRLFPEASTSSQKPSGSERSMPHTERLRGDSSTAQLAGDYSKQQDSHRPLLLVLTVEIDQDRSGTVEVREGDDPQALARSFIDQHGLAEHIAAPLSQHIAQNIAQIPVLRRAQSAPTTPQHAGHPRSEDSQTFVDARMRPQSAGEHHRMRAATDGSVYSRLYVEANEQRGRTESLRRNLEAERRAELASTRVGICKISSELMRHRGIGAYGNYGERLYVEGVLQRQAKRVQEEAAERERAATEGAALLFKPEISDFARALGREPAAAALVRRRHEEHKRRKMALVKQELEQQRYEECTFRPAVNRKSERITRERMEALRHHNIPYHEQLFQDAERRQQRLQEYQTYAPPDLTFQPQLIATPPNQRPLEREIGFSSSSEEGDRDGSNAPGCSFLERVAATHTRTQRRLEEARANGLTDPETGKPFFHPRTGRAPSYQRNSSNLPIGDFLYAMRYEFSDKKEYLAERERQIQVASASTQYSTTQSQKLLASLKRRKYRQIFEALDNDDDGVVNTGDFHLEQFPEELTRDLRQVQSLASNTDIALEKFIELMERVLRTGAKSGGVRTYMLPDARYDDEKRRYRAQSAPPCRPEICETSRQIAARLNRGDGAKIEDKLLQAYSESQRKLRAMQEDKAAAEMAECTFQPCTTSQGGQGKVLHSLGLSIPSGTRNTKKQAQRSSMRFSELDRELREALGAQYWDSVVEDRGESTGAGTEFMNSSSERSFQALRHSLYGGVSTGDEELLRRFGVSQDQIALWRSALAGEHTAAG